MYLVGMVLLPLPSYGQISLPTTFKIPHLQDIFRPQPAQLNQFSIENMNHSQQIVFEFSSPLKVEHPVDNVRATVTLDLPGIDKGALEKLDVMKKLQGMPYVQSVALNTKAKNHTQLVISFKADDALVKLNTFDKPYRIILDVFSKDRLRNISQQRSIGLTQACLELPSYCGGNAADNFFPKGNASAEAIMLMVSAPKGVFSHDVANHVRHALSSDGRRVLLSKSQHKNFILNKDFTRHCGAGTMVSINGLQTSGISADIMRLYSSIESKNCDRHVDITSESSEYCARMLVKEINQFIAV